MQILLLFVGLVMWWSVNSVRLMPVSNIRKSVNNPPDENKLMRKFLNLKIGKHKHSIWYYQGQIRDPVNGRKIVGIEGIEKVSISKNQKNFSVSVGATNSTTRKLSVDSDLASTSPNSYLSHKVFLYVEANNRTNPILSFRKTKMAPARSVNPFTEIVEHIQLNAHVPSRSTNNYEKNSIIDESSGMSGQVPNSIPCRLKTTIVWPGGRLIEGKMTIEEDSVKEGLAASLLVNHSVRGRKKRIVNKWIEFGPNGEANVGKSNEVYRIHESAKKWFFNNRVPLKSMQDHPSQTILSSTGMVYKRYGLSPAWLAPNKPCEIELRGFRLDNINDIPNSVIETFRPFASDYFDSSVPMESLMSDVNRDPLAKFKPWYKKLVLLLYR